MANTFIFDDDEPQADPSGLDAESPEPGKPEGGEGSNRNFLIAAIVLGGVVLLSLVFMAAYALVILPKQKASAQATSDANAAANTQVVISQQQTQEASFFTPTLEASGSSSSSAPLKATSTVMPAPTKALPTATQLKVATSAAGANPVTAVPSPTLVSTQQTGQLAKTGFADEFGLPGLFITAILLVAIIFISRRLRNSPAKV
ncbi:MAG: hypothetical protein WCP19_00785 [Chloroflexota bacterium]